MTRYNNYASYVLGPAVGVAWAAAPGQHRSFWHVLEGSGLDAVVRESSVELHVSTFEKQN